MTKTAPEDRRRRVLFVTWDGPEYHYLEGLFLPIFHQLRGHGYDFHVLQFTWGDPDRRAAAAQAASDLGIGYSSVEVIRRPVSAGSLLTAILGARQVRNAVRTHGSDIVLARSTLPALATILARRAADRWRFVFDLDGLPVDERVEFADLDPRSPVARLQWAIERKAIRLADAVTTRSSLIRSLVVERGGPATRPDKIFRVANCRDEDRFVPPSPEQRNTARQRLGLPPQAPVIAYVGSSLSGKYRGDCLMDFFASVRRRLPLARLLVISGDQEQARALVSSRVPELAADIVIEKANASDVPFLLGAADLGTAFIDPAPSMRAAAAVKLGEYLLCGLPVVATTAIGDVHQRLGPPSAFFIDSNGPAELARAADWFCSCVMAGGRESARSAARAAGLAEYGLEAGAENYAQALRFSERNNSISRGAWLESE